jgi:hypothetical protein
MSTSQQTLITPLSKRLAERLKKIEISKADKEDNAEVATWALERYH